MYCKWLGGCFGTGAVFSQLVPFAFVVDARLCEFGYCRMYIMEGAAVVNDFVFKINVLVFRVL